MHSLFMKIFLYFLLIILLVATSVMVLTHFRDQEFPPLAHQDFARRAMTEYGREAIRVYEKEGSAAVDLYTEHLRQESGISLRLFDQQGQLLSHQPLSRRAYHMAARALRSGEVVFPVQGTRNGLAATVKGPGGNTYVVVITLPERPHQPKEMFRGMTHGFLGGQLLILLAITALVCYLLARSLASPIRRLRQATHRFASGDLTTRIGSRIKGKTELAGLAGDFDEMAEKIEALISGQQQLLRDLSHELRSPLARLNVALELARNKAPGEAQDKALNRIALEAERMNVMIGQLLGLTRMASGPGEQTFDRFDFYPLLQKLVADADYEAAACSCRVVLDGISPAIVLGSEVLLAQALENVIRNAVKYTAENSTVFVRLTEENGYWIITVTDQGAGVPELALEKIFEPFYRVADARDRDSGGTGIGLAIAQRAIALHRGTIRAQNLPQGGLQIRISLPRSSEQ